MKIMELEGVGGNKLGSNTAPIATANNSDFRFVSNGQVLEGSLRRAERGGVFEGRSHEERRERMDEGDGFVWERRRRGREETII